MSKVEARGAKKHAKKLRSKAHMKAIALQLEGKRAAKGRYPHNSNYYGKKKRKRPSDSGDNPPPQDVANDLLKDGYAYGKKLTPEQVALFTRAGQGGVRKKRHA